MGNPDIAAYATTDGKAPTTDKKNWPSNAEKLTGGKFYDSKGKEILSPKQIAVNYQKDSLSNGIELLSATSNIPGLKDLVSF